jgi:hypothetical protein
VSIGKVRQMSSDARIARATVASNSPAATSPQATTPPTTAPPTTTTIPVRQVAGKATTIGAGTFTGGRDVVQGLYDVTAAPGQSGNFIVDGTNRYDEILGGSDGVSRVRARIAVGDQIEVSGLSGVTFTPVTAPFVRTHTPVSLYTGTFAVGQDVGPGRYVVTPGPGQSGNFIVDGNDEYDEILGRDPSSGDVPSLTVTLTRGDTVTISGLNSVSFAPAA